MHISIITREPRAAMHTGAAPGEGNCYEANGKFILSKLDDDSYKLCHGVAVSSTDGEPFGHAWIEKESLGVAMDFSNGKRACFPRQAYYEAGRIPVGGHPVYSYTGREALQKMLDTEHWGPWNSKPPR